MFQRCFSRMSVGPRQGPSVGSQQDLSRISVGSSVVSSWGVFSRISVGSPIQLQQGLPVTFLGTFLGASQELQQGLQQSPQQNLSRISVGSQQDFYLEASVATSVGSSVEFFSRPSVGVPAPTLPQSPGDLPTGFLERTFSKSLQQPSVGSSVGSQQNAPRRSSVGLQQGSQQKSQQRPPKD